MGDDRVGTCYNSTLGVGMLKTSVKLTFVYVYTLTSIDTFRRRQTYLNVCTNHALACGFDFPGINDYAMSKLKPYQLSCRTFSVNWPVRELVDRVPGNHND